ncbi:PH domain-like [Phytophthora cactorum]|nr:PH domain-like [Phytophthora cactorum]
MGETSSSECEIEIVGDDDKPKYSGGEFKPLTSGQLLLKTRHKSDRQHRGLLDGADDDDDDQDEQDGSGTQALLAAIMTLLVWASSTLWCWGSAGWTRADASGDHPQAPPLFLLGSGACIAAVFFFTWLSFVLLSLSSGGHGHLPLTSTAGLLFSSLCNRVCWAPASAITGAQHIMEKRARWDERLAKRRLAHFPIALPITQAAQLGRFSAEDTTPMTRQGYLIVHDKRTRPTVRYLSLEDGFLRQYASTDCTKCLSEVRLSGCKITVKAQKRADGVPNSFYLETRKVFVKIGPTRWETGEDRQDWGKALFSWQRYYWRDPVATTPENNSATSETRLQLEQIIAKHFVQKPSSGHSISFAAAKQPISFLRRNAHTLRRSLSLTMTSTVTNAAKPESDADPTDCVKDKVTKNNNVCAAVTPHYLPPHLDRGNNQEAH